MLLIFKVFFLREKSWLHDDEREFYSVAVVRENSLMNITKYVFVVDEIP